MKLYFEVLPPYATRIRNIYLNDYPWNFSRKLVEPIIHEMIDFIYENRAKDNNAKDKHVISRFVLMNFVQAFQKQLYVQDGNKIITPNVDNKIFCLNPSKQNFWSNDIEVFFNPIETASDFVLKSCYELLTSGKDNKLIDPNTLPYGSNNEVKLRLVLALYMAMHVERQLVAQGHSSIDDEDFLHVMKKRTTSFFFHLWSWCKVDSPTFIIPVGSPVTRFDWSNGKHEWFLPLAPNIALFAAENNDVSFISGEYWRDDIRTRAELTGMEDTFLGSSEDEGQQRFIIQTGNVKFNVSHSNYRVDGAVIKKDYTFSQEPFKRMTGIIKSIHPFHVKPQ